MHIYCPVTKKAKQVSDIKLFRIFAGIVTELAGMIGPAFWTRTGRWNSLCDNVVYRGAFGDYLASFQASSLNCVSLMFEGYI